MGSPGMDGQKGEKGDTGEKGNAIVCAQWKVIKRLSSGQCIHLLVTQKEIVTTNPQPLTHNQWCNMIAITVTGFWGLKWISSTKVK